VGKGGSNNKLGVPDFNNFHNWVANRLGYYESTSGWAYMIEDQRRDKEEALWLLFELLDEFREIRHAEVARINYQQHFNLDGSQYCRMKKVRGTFKAIKKPRPKNLSIKRIDSGGGWYSLIALNNKNEILDIRNADDLKMLFKKANEIYGVEQEEWR
jgi:hypothetical protein